MYNKNTPLQCNIELFCGLLSIITTIFFTFSATSPGYVVSSPPYGHPPPLGGQYPGYNATAPPPPFYGHPAMYPPMYMDPAYAGQR